MGLLWGIDWAVDSTMTHSTNKRSVDIVRLHIRKENSGHDEPK